MQFVIRKLNEDYYDFKIEMLPFKMCNELGGAGRPRPYAHRSFVVTDGLGIGLRI